ncbi:unnamed protein product [Blepharisma stoltei]|uniref:Uncharacterized protein n=1 Tax=Blepharisma stoltei TaxID=1481888 RepID=A0AAU9KC92_9CILI|nr:unnamed protein product [Blepharisma stoltei]
MDFSNYLKRKRCDKNTPMKAKRSSSGAIATPIYITFPKNEKAIKYKISMSMIVEDTVRENSNKEEVYNVNFAELYEKELGVVKELGKKLENAASENNILNTDIKNFKTNHSELLKAIKSAENDAYENNSKFDKEITDLSNTLEAVEIEKIDETLKIQAVEDKLKCLSNNYFEEKESIQMIEKGIEKQEIKIKKSINKKLSLERRLQSSLKAVSLMKSTIEELSRYQMEDEKCKLDILLQISSN